MVNAHSHAFQIDLRGVAERPSAPRRRLLELAHRDVPARRRARPRLDARRRRARVRGRWRAPATARSASSTTSTTSPTGGPTRSPTRWRSRSPRRRVRRGSRSSLLPAAYHRAGWDRRPAADPGQRRFCDRDVDAFLARVDALRGVGAPGSRASASASPSTASARCRRAGSTAVARVRRARTTWSATSTPASSAASSPSARPSTAARRSSCSTAAASSARARASSTAIHVSERRHRAARRAAARSSSACPTTEGNLGDGYLPALRYRAAGVPLAIGTDSQVRIDPFEEVARARDRRAARGPDALRAARRRRGDLWGHDRARRAARASGSPGPGARSRSTSTTPTWRGSPRATSRTRSRRARRRRSSRGADGGAAALPGERSSRLSLLSGERSFPPIAPYPYQLDYRRLPGEQLHQQACRATPRRRRRARMSAARRRS